MGGERVVIFSKKTRKDVEGRKKERRSTDTHARTRARTLGQEEERNRF